MHKFRIRDAGLTLPDYYGDAMSNQVEAGGYTTAEDVWYALKGSTSHRHLLAELPFIKSKTKSELHSTKTIQRPMLNIGQST